MKKVVWFSFLAMAVMLVAGLAIGVRYSPQDHTQRTSSSAQPSAAVTEHEHSPTDRVPAHYTTPPSLDVLAPTLDPQMFTGNQRLAYQVAKEIPQTLAQLPCYCHCDMSAGHKSLQSCFVTEHGENCGICIGEALMAYQLEKREKLPVAEIRRRIIAAYGKNHSD